MRISFEKNIVLKGKIECLTGLHIGGSNEKLAIGGVDSPVVRNPATNYPYLPGSSLKGKLRSLLELYLGVLETDSKGDTGPSKALEVRRLFGWGADNEKMPLEKHHGPTRLIVRDCQPDQWTIQLWESVDSELIYTEYKAENGIDRLTSAANPRFVERVVAGSRFDFEIVYTAYKKGEDADKKGENADATAEDLQNLRTALTLLEHNYLGKSGTRGYGHIKFWFCEPITLDKEAYRATESEQLQLSLKSVDEICQGNKNYKAEALESALKPLRELQFVELASHE